MATILCGCGPAGRLGSFQAGDGRLEVELPAVCEAFLQRVPVPPVTAKTDAHIAFIKVDAALDEANGRIENGGSCVRDQRELYAGKEKPK